MASLNVLRLFSCSSPRNAIKSREVFIQSRATAFKYRNFSFQSGVKAESKPISLTKMCLISTSVGLVAGTGYALYNRNKTKLPISNENKGPQYNIVALPPDLKISRSIVSPTDNTGLKLKLFQYPTCPFCCKVRAFLDYYGFSYDVIEVDPVLRQQIGWSKYKKVPILLANVEGGYLQLNDSSMIISALASYLNDRDQPLKDLAEFYPTIEYNDEAGNYKKEIMNRYFLMYGSNFPKAKPKEDLLMERKWRQWADDSLVHVLSPNVYRTQQEAFQSFNWFSEVGEWDKLFPTWERWIMVYVGAFAMWLISKRLKKRHNLKDDVRQSLYDDCNLWVKTLKIKGTQFLGGDKPNLADLAVFGVLSSIEGCEAFQDVLKKTKIGIWFRAMKQCIQNHSGTAAMGSSFGRNIPFYLDPESPATPL